MSLKPFKSVSLWLAIGCAMVLIQIALGGITRLTDSGLSITEWKLIQGTLPPSTDVEWEHSFQQYKLLAKKQFESIHSNMSIEEYKKIFFWEYFHRLWARLMGVVFIIPFLYFLIRKKLNSSLIKQLLLVIFLASLSAIFGWIMVASGSNNDKRTWVNAYNLLIHLCLAVSLFSYLFLTLYRYQFAKIRNRIELINYPLLLSIGIVLFIQIALGALMAGMKAALIFPYPLVLTKWSLFSQMFQQSPPIVWTDWINYEPNIRIKLIVQTLHRLTAYSLLGLSVWFFIVHRVKMFIFPSYFLFYVFLMVQLILGLLTVWLSIGKVPINLGVLHQMTAFLLLASYLWILHSSRPRR